MAEIVLFHHALGPTDGLAALADTLRGAGHIVHQPDLYQGHRFASLDQGVAYAQSVGFETIIGRGRDAVAALPADLVYIGISLGVLSAQALAQSRPGARGAILLEACVPTEMLGGSWPAGVPVEIHGMDQDPSFAGEGDLQAAQALVATAGSTARLYTYPGSAHLFTDASLPSYDPSAAQLVMDRMRAFLARA